MSKRYGIICVGTNYRKTGIKYHVVSHATLKIVKVLKKYNCTYSTLQQRTMLPLNTLYVFIGRMKKLKLVTVWPALDGRSAYLEIDKTVEILASPAIAV